MKMKCVILLLVILGFSCGNNDDKSRGTINLKINECFDQLGNGARICLDSVFNDSRCPTEVECVWKGDAVAALTLSKNEQIRKFNLHINNNFQNDTIIDGSNIKLLNISPYPVYNEEINSNDYVVEISID